MNIQLTDTIDSILARNLKAAKVLNQQGIDFCGDGRTSLKVACAEANVSFRKLLRDIRKAELYRNATPDVATLPIDELTRFVERHHHVYMYENITFIKSNLSRLVRIFRNRNGEIEALSNVFEEMTAHLTIHMQHEEQIVFPYIREMVKRNKRVTSAPYRSVESPIAAMIEEHAKENPFLSKLEALTHHYTVPPNTGNAYKITYESMNDFEKDLHAHLAIENEILFPKALELESGLKRTYTRRRTYHKNKTTY